MLVHGPKSKQFEKDFAAFTQAPFALSIASCTAGLHLFYFDLGIGPGDEVIVPAQTHSATAHAVEFTGANCVFVDCEADTGNIDPEGLESAITKNTRAISLVHFLGKPADMTKIMPIAQKHNLPVLEDCALSIGATVDGVHTGLIGDAGCFSFYPVKHMTTAEGGMFITKRAGLAERIGYKRAFGVDRVVGERKVPGVYDVPNLGYNYRMNEMEAALGVEQLKRMDGFLKARRDNYRHLAPMLSELEEIRVLNSDDENGLKSSHYCLSIILEENLAKKRYELVEKLKEKGVGTSVYYPRPVPHMTYYKQKYKVEDFEFANASAISYKSIALPVGPHLGPEDMEYIAAKVKSSIHEV